ncbi:NLR family CARD domain-containing protein 4-like isoform X1 [Branchiostoma floridae]|uniref:NLR family CARD domain-containing protein 4-like isoform X1 n=1 Tax=Branchiostoma floridae TaxID=7739 RepID=A0A9J7N6J9_BRAFL|nr:NLR family CARD domain-containing protein 4-like isoform X1 [Branchiostoma floridae]
MSWTDRFNNPGYKNWLRVGIALLTTRDGLTNVTEQAAKELQAELKTKLGDSVQNCTCNPKSRGCKDCDPWRDELKKYYTGDANRIGWTNCTPNKWRKEPWEVAKVFMLKGQPADNTGPEKSDPSALLNFLVFCNYCRKYISKVEPLKNVIEVRNKTMHSLDLRLDRQTFNEYMDKMERLLRLVGDPTAQKAAKEIFKIKKEEFHIGAGKACMDAEVRVLTDVMNEHQKLLQLHREELEDHGTRLDTLEHCTVPKEEMLKTVEVLLKVVKNNTDLHRALKDQALELSATVQQLQDRLGKAERDITEVRGAMGQLEEVVAEHEEQIEEVKTDNKRLQEEVSDVKKQNKKIKLSVDVVKQKLEAPSGSTPSLEVFQKSVKKYYQLKLSHFKPLIWNDNFTLTLSDIFTQLELVPTSEKQLKTFENYNRSESMGGEQRKELKSLDDLFNPDITGLSTAPRCILIEGEAGGGKTTFLSKEALDAVSQKTELSKRNKIVLFIRLREVRKGETIEKMVWDQCVDETTKGIDVQSIKTILQRNESRVLFLLDGYDELRPEARAAGQAIPKLLSGKLYPNSTIVITSRPSAGVQQYTRPDCHIHIMGFSKEHVEQCTQQYFTFVKKQELAETLAEHVKTNEILNSLIYTPIFLLFVCVLWEEDQKMVSTGTMTGLYDNLLTCLVRKHCEREKKRKKEKRKQEAISTKELPTEVAESLLQLGKVALKALLRNETLLDLTEVERENVNLELLFKLGVVSLEVSSSKLHPRKQLNFSHKTMQEFLAGRYVAHALLNQQDIVELLQLTSITKALELSNLLQFTCGCDSRAAQAVMEELSNLSKKEFSDLRLANFQKKSHLPVKAKSKKSVQTYKRFMSLCLDVLNERKELHVLQAVSKALPVIIMDLHMNGMFGLNSKQHAALKYYMENMQSSHLPDRVILEPFLVNVSKSLQYLEQLVTSPIPGLKVDLRLMYVTFDSPVPDKTVQHLQQCLPGLRVDLYVSGQCNSPDETARLASFLKNVPGLRALDLSRTRLTPSSLQPLVQGFSHMSLLEELDLTGNRGLGDAGMEVLQVGLSSVPHLAVLRLRDVTMTAVGMSSLAPYMRHLVGLRELDISYSYKIGDTRLESLTTVLPIFTAMQVLVLQCIGISPTGMRTLVPALCQLTRLIKLDFSWNDIGDPGLECLAAILPHLTAMKVLVLSVTGISDRGISALIKALPHLVQLQVLGVSGNNIGDSGIVSLVQTLCQPSSLDMEQNPPGDKSLTTAPHYNTTQPGTLQELSIGRNRRVTGAGLGRVAQLISALPALTRLDMSGYREHTPAHLSDTAAMALAEALPRLPALEELKLFVISMEPAGFQAVVQAAEEHPTLERLIYTKRLVPEGADTTASCLRLR